MAVDARQIVEIGYGGSERLTMNMGPQHPSAHGVFRAVLTLEGETVVAVDAAIGYLHRFHQVGGTRYDVPAGWDAKVRETVGVIEQRIDEYEAMLEGNPFFLARARGVGVISRALAEEVGVSGPLIRGSGVSYDIRRAEPYSSYEAFDFKVPVETEGDCWARYRVRMVEFRESIGIVRQALEGLPPGPISSRPGVKSVGQVRIGKGETYARVEDRKSV